MMENVSELEAAIAAGFQMAESESRSANAYWGDPSKVDKDIIDGITAFAAYCEQVAALQAENARLRSRLRESGVNELEARQQKTPPPTEK